MALTLAQAAILSENQLAKGVMETFVLESSLLDRIPLMNIQGNAFAYNLEETLPGVEFRAVNSQYAESTGTVNQKTESLVILGGKANVDRFIVKTRGNLNDQRAIQTALKVKAASYKFQDTFINGDVAVDANSFDGLKKRLTGAQNIVAGTNGLGFGTTDDSRQDAFDIIDALLSAVPGANAIYMNAKLLGKIRSAMRRLTMNTTPIQEFGKTIDTYNGVRLIDIGKKPDGSEIIPNTETSGSSSLTTSAYAVKFGQDESDGGVTGLTNGGVDVIDFGLVPGTTYYQAMIEFYCGVAIFSGKAAARLSGILTT